MTTRNRPARPVVGEAGRTFFLPLRVSKLSRPNHDPGQHDIIDAGGTVAFSVVGTHELATSIVASLNADCATPHPLTRPAGEVRDTLAQRFKDAPLHGGGDRDECEPFCAVDLSSDERDEVVAALSAPPTPDDALVRALQTMTELIDHVSPNEEVGTFDGSGQWIALATVSEIRKWSDRLAASSTSAKDAE